MTDYLHSGANKMNKVEAYKNDNKLLLADKLGHAKVSSLKEQNLLNTIATVQQHSNKITQLEADANKVRGAYVYKGTVETEFDLPLNNNSVGDVYNTSSTGMNYAWNGENWDELGSTTVGGTSSEWEWAQSYVQTLDSASYTDWDAPWYSGISIQGIPSTGTDYLMIIIKVPQNGTFLSNNTYAIFSGDHPKNSPYITIAAPSITQQEQASTKTLTFLLTKKHGLYLVKAFKANNNVPTERIYSQSLYPIPQTLNHAYLYGHDLPSGSTIETYIPNTFITS